MGEPVVDDLLMQARAAGAHFDGFRHGRPGRGAFAFEEGEVFRMFGAVFFPPLGKGMAVMQFQTGAHAHAFQPEVDLVVLLPELFFGQLEGLRQVLVVVG